jgi:foldase protein PrsA
VFSSHWRWVAVAVLLATPLVSGCSRGVVAVVNGEKITEDEFIREMEKRIGKQVLVDMVNRAMLEQAAREQGLAPTEQDVDAELARRKQRLPDESTFNRLLLQQGLTLEDYRDMLRMEMSLERLLSAGVQVTEAEAREFFDKNREHYSTPALVNYSLIVVGSKKDAEAVIAELKKGADFAALARQKCVDEALKATGGEIGWRTKEQIVPPAMAPMLFSMKSGEITPPVSAQGQWLVAKVVDKQAAKNPTFEDVKEQVIRDVKAAKGKSAQELLVELRSKARVSILRPYYEDVAQVFSRTGLGQEMWPTGAGPADKGKAAPSGEVGKAPAAGAPKAPSPPAATGGKAPTPPAPAAPEPASGAPPAQPPAGR